MEIKTTSKLSAKAIGYIFCGAFEGGSNYWMQSADLVTSEHTLDPNNNLVWWGHDELYEKPFTFEVGYDDPDQEEGNGEGRKTLSYPDDVQKGLQIMAEKYPSHFAELADEENGNPDAITYDVAMQCIILGDLVYG